MSIRELGSHSPTRQVRRQQSSTCSNPQYVCTRAAHRRFVPLDLAGRRVVCGKSLSAHIIMICTAFFLAVAATRSANAAPRSTTVENDELGSVLVLAPTTEPARMFLLISDSDGLTPQRTAEAEMLVAQGAAVALIDLAAYKARQSKKAGDDCIEAFDDFEDLARLAQRQLGMTEWRWPVLFGIGEGGTLAYLTVAQAPVNTAGGAVSIGFAPEFKSVGRLCPGAPTLAKTSDGVIYAPMKSMPSPWKLVVAANPTDDVKEFVNAGNDASIDVVPGDDSLRFSAAAAAAFTMKAPRADALSDLPLTELQGSGNSETLVIFISGDGGWRDLDKQIGEYLSQRGISVIGVDAFRYFWRRKDPEQIAADLGRISEHYLNKWNLQAVAFVGYSFGADVLPLAWPKLSRTTQDQTKLIALLGLEPTANLEVSVYGWLGVKTDFDIDVRPYLSGLPKSRVLCFFGTDESKEGETACVDAALDGSTRVERPGGHHFDGKYEIIADIILQRLNAKTPEVPKPEQAQPAR